MPADDLRRTAVVDTIKTARVLVRVAVDDRMGATFTVEEGRELLPNYGAATPRKPSFTQKSLEGFWAEEIAIELGGRHYYEVAWHFVLADGRLLRKLEATRVTLKTPAPR
jgi:hypothetical protein